jgi:hypothetical protein
MNEGHEADWEELIARLRQMPSAPEDPLWRLAAALVPDEDYSHEQAEAELPAYVTDELLGRAVAQLYPALHRHLWHCARCASLHDEMLALLAEEGEAMPVPAPDLAFLPPVDWQQETVRVAEAILNRVWPGWQEPLARLAAMFFAGLERGAEVRLSRRGVALPALAFGGGEAPLALRVLVATYLAHEALRNRFGDWDEVMAGLATRRREIEEVVREAAQEAGIPGRRRSAFVAAYLAAVAGTEEGESRP